MKMTLLRHGSRDLTMSSDGGLNRAGHELASQLAGRIQPEGKLPRPTHLICSPKRRARETLTPLSAALGLKLEISELIDERQNDESSSEFRARVRNFLELLPKQYTSSDALYVCSHADWLEEAIAVLPSDLPQMIADSGFACGELRTFELKDELWEYSKTQSG